MLEQNENKDSIKQESILTPKQLKNKIDNIEDQILEEEKQKRGFHKYFDWDYDGSDISIRIDDKYYKLKWIFITIGLLILLIILGIVTWSITRNNLEAVYQFNPKERIYLQYVNQDNEGTPNYQAMTKSEKVKVLAYSFQQSLFRTDEVIGHDNRDHPAQGTCQALFALDNPRAQTYNGYIERIRSGDNSLDVNFDSVVNGLVGESDIDIFKKDLHDQLTLAADNETEVDICTNLTNLLLSLKERLFQNLGATDETKTLLVQKILATYEHIQKNDPDLFVYTGLSNNLNNEMNLMKHILGEEYPIQVRLYQGSDITTSRDLCKLYLDEGVFFDKQIKECGDSNIREIVQSAFDVNKTHLFSQLTYDEKQECYSERMCIKVGEKLTDAGWLKIWLSIAFITFLYSVIGCLIYKKFLRNRIIQYTEAQKKITELNKEQQKIQNQLNKVFEDSKEMLEDLLGQTTQLKEDKNVQLKEVEERIKKVIPNEEG